MLWGWEKFCTNLQNFVPDRQVDSHMGPNNPSLGPMFYLCESGLTTTMLPECQMYYVNLQRFGDVEISEGTMGHSNYSLGPMLSSNSSSS